MDCQRQQFVADWGLMLEIKGEMKGELAVFLSETGT
jgi:hypothetical protein